MLIKFHHSRWSKDLNVLLVSALTFLLCSPDLSHAIDDGETPFKPGKALRVTIWQQPDLSGDYSIDSEGYVIFPLIGRIKVSRYTRDSLKSYLSSEYSNYLRSPIITIEPLIRVSVLGEVKAPGLFRVNPESPLWDVIEMTGGPTTVANMKKIKVMRRGKVINKELLIAFENGESLNSLGFKSGDQIVVPRARRVMEWRTVIALISLSITTTFFIIRQVK